MTETAKTRLFHGTVLPLVAAISVLSLDSHAQQQEASAQALEEVIVFSRYREESLQEVPDTIVALDALEIEQKGITNLMDLTRSIPNMDFDVISENIFYIMIDKGQIVPRAGARARRIPHFL